jgi:hypothetical protein
MGTNLGFDTPLTFKRPLITLAVIFMVGLSSCKLSPPNKVFRFTSPEIVLPGMATRVCTDSVTVEVVTAVLVAMVWLSILVSLVSFDLLRFFETEQEANNMGIIKYFSISKIKYLK